MAQNSEQELLNQIYESLLQLEKVLQTYLKALEKKTDRQLDMRQLNEALSNASKLIAKSVQDAEAAISKQPDAQQEAETAIGTQPDTQQEAGTAISTQPDTQQEAGTAIGTQPDAPKQSDGKKDDNSWMPNIPSEDDFPPRGKGKEYLSKYQLWFDNGGLDRLNTLKSPDIKVYGCNWAHWHGHYPYPDKDGSYKVSECGVTSEYTVTNGKVNGLCKVYNESSGALEKEENYVDNKMHGPYKEYYENGALKLEVNYVNGIAQGPLKEYFPDGKPKTECTFKDGLLNGSYKVYCGNGLLSAECTFADGLMHGTYRSYHISKGYSLHAPDAEPGVIRQEVNYVNGKKEGEDKHYEYSGDGTYYLAMVDTFRNGKKNGVHKWYWPNGVVRGEGTYVDGITEGLYKAYYSTGQLKAEEIHKNGELISSKKYDKEGNMTEALSTYIDAGLRKKEENEDVSQSTGKENAEDSSSVLRKNSQSVDDDLPKPVAFYGYDK